MSTVDCGPPRENDAICVHVSTMRTHGVRHARGCCCMRMHVRSPEEWNKWKNHFYEMKGEVGMSWHEKERQQEVAYTKTESNS